MQRPPHRVHQRLAGPLALVALLTPIASLAAHPQGATAAAVANPDAATAAARQGRAEAARVARYWTPARMRAARPLDLAVDRQGRSHLRVGRASEEGAGASFVGVPTPEVPPFSFNGRVFLRRGKLAGFCSRTAIDSPTRQLVLTAGHCLNSGREEGKRSVWSRYLEFVPGYKGGAAPFGIFVARRGDVRAPRQWTGHGNPDFDLGAFLARPNSDGTNLADAVGGGAAIATDLSRHQKFQSFGYPGKSRFMRTCASGYIGDDLFSAPLPGPPTLGIHCHWPPGSSGGGWLIDGGTQINGISTYFHSDEDLGHSRGAPTFSPYFSAATVGRLVRDF
jgi:hypothetical protein